MTYDNWRTTNPADEFLGPEPEEDEEMDMVERVARAIAAVNHEDDFDRSDEARRMFIEDARAAIAAMREPTEEMVKAQWSEPTCGAEGWRAMIDAALNEK
jgi:hypothetical protein